MARYLITGASGFIGGHVAERLASDGHQLRCLVRETSSVEVLEPLGVELVHGSITDRAAVASAVKDIDVVIHLAGMTSAQRYQQMLHVNRDGSWQVARACAEQAQPPILLVVSSIAAAGPVPRGRIRSEHERPSPISNYGTSKRAGEAAAEQFADRVPTTIVRPGVVFGPRNRDFFPVFHSVARSRLHLVMGLAPPRISLIHVEDLVEILVRAAVRGERVDPGEKTPGSGRGYYFGVCDEYPDYARLGKMLKHLLREDGRGIPFFLPSPLSWLVGGLTQLISALRGTSITVNLDKVREAYAPSWACSTRAVSEQLAFQPQADLASRLLETADWYRRQGWMK
ncbi:MAG: SDR family NAD(P)-dependent oxidoreductase [Planctomycetota bacterium]|nr:SDR family NAD(P)-dependent oxidoreductase [Planctomycetota bacterium]